MENECVSAECGCGQQECSCYEMDRMAMMMCLVKEAKMELLKEKIKKKLEEADGKRLDSIAGLLVEAVTDCRKGKEDLHRKMEEMRSKFESAFRQE